MKLDDVVYLENIDRSPKHVKAVRQMLKEVSKEIEEEFMTIDEAKALISAEIYDLDCQHNFKWTVSEENDYILIRVSHTPLSSFTCFQVYIVPQEVGIE